MKSRFNENSKVEIKASIYLSAVIEHLVFDVFENTKVRKNQIEDSDLKKVLKNWDKFEIITINKSDIDETDKDESLSIETEY